MRTANESTLHKAVRYASNAAVGYGIFHFLIVVIGVFVWAAAYLRVYRYPRRRRKVAKMLDHYTHPSMGYAYTCYAFVAFLCCFEVQKLCDKDQRIAAKLAQSK